MWFTPIRSTVFTNSVYTDQEILPQAKVELQCTVEQSVTQTCHSDFYQDRVPGG